MYIEINLLPESFYKAKKKKQLITYLIIGGIAIISFFVVLYIYRITQVAYLDNEIAKLKKEQAKYMDTLNKIDSINKDKSELETRLKGLSALLDKQAIWIKLLDDINKVTTDNIWFKIINNKQDATGKGFTIEGFAVSKAAVADLLYSLQKSNYFTNIVLVSLIDSGKSSLDRVTFKIACNSKI